MKLILAFLLLASQAFATSLCIRTHDKECFADGTCRKSIGYGSGVVIDETADGNYVAVTAKHVVDGATADTAAVCISGQWLPITKVYTLPGEDDVAFITFKSERQLKRTLLADKEESPGDPIRFSGYSGGTTFERVNAMVKQVKTVGFATTEVRPKQGQSGGGVYDQRGHLIGVVSGYTNDTGSLVYTPITRVRRHCHRHWGFSWGVCWGPPPLVVVPPPPVVIVPRPPVVSPVDPDIAPPPPVDKPAEKPQPPSVVSPSCRCKNDCKCDLATFETRIKVLEDEIAALKATKIPVQIIDPDGKVIEQESFVFGKPLKIKLTPIEKKPADASVAGKK